MRGTVIGYIKEYPRSSAKVRIDYAMDSDREVPDFNFSAVEVLAELPHEEASLFEGNFASPQPIGECVQKDSQDYFEVLEISPRRKSDRIIVSRKSYLYPQYMQLMQVWAGLGEDPEYACLRATVPPGLNASEAMIEAERLAREDFEIRINGLDIPFDDFGNWEYP